MGDTKLIGVALLCSLVPALGVAMLKGRWTLVLSGICLLFPLWWYGAVALALPQSWWARRFYGEAKLERARAAEARWARSFGE